MPTTRSVHYVFACLTLIAACSKPSPADHAAPPAAPTASASTDTLWLRAPDSARDAVYATDDEAALIRRYGQANVRRDSLPGAEGESTYGTVLFPEDSLRTLYVYWNDDHPFARAGSVATGPAARAWVVAPGLAIGTLMADVEALNGHAFDLFGFEWDYGGNVTDWHGGRLGVLWDHGTGDNATRDVMVRFRADDPPRSITGEGTYSSSLAAMRTARPRVSELTVTVR